MHTKPVMRTSAVFSIMLMTIFVVVGPTLVEVAEVEAQAQEASEPEAAPAAEPQGAAGQEQSAASEQEQSVTGEQAAEATAPAADSGGYVVRLKGLEEKVNELKERIFRSKARLNLLKETVLHGVIAGSRAVIKHKDTMGATFRLIKLVYAIDGAQIFSKSADDGTLDAKREFEVFNGSIVPGNHVISVQMVFRGHGYGIFTYLKGYRFTVRGSHTFTAAEGRQNMITVKAYEKGNATTELRDRPAVKFETTLYKVSGRGAAAGAPQ